MTDKRRADNGLAIRRAHKKAQTANELRLRSCMTKFDDGRYTRLQFLRAASHSITHIDAIQPASSDDTDDDDDQSQPVADDHGDTCQVCLQAPRSAVALVPCGHAQFCSTVLTPCPAWTAGVLCVACRYRLLCSSLTDNFALRSHSEDICLLHSLRRRAAF